MEHLNNKMEDVRYILSHSGDDGLESANPDVVEYLAINLMDREIEAMITNPKRNSIIKYLIRYY